MKSKLMVLSAALMLVLTGCPNNNGGDFVPDTPVTSTGDDTTIHVESVSLNQSNATLAIGESITLVATVLPENAANKNVTWSATGDGVVSVDDGVVTALKAGTAVVTVKTADGNRTAVCNITVNEAATEETLELYKEDEKPANSWVYWRDQQDWCGSVITMNTNKKVGNTLTFDYTVVSGYCEWGFQVFYKNSSLATGASYRLTAKIKSKVAVADGLLKINGTYVTLAAGENTIAVKYVEGGATSSSFQLVASTAIGSNEFEISDVSWEGILDIPGSIALDAAQKKITFGAVDGAASYEVKYYDSNKNYLDKETVSASGATLTKVPTTNGNYFVSVTAISALDTKYDSVESSLVLFKVGTDAIVPAGGPKTNISFGEEANLPFDKFVYWAGEWGWTGGQGQAVVQAGDAYTEDGLLNITYTSEGNCKWGLQIFYKNTSLTSGTTYIVSFKVKSANSGSVYPKSADDAAVNLTAETWTTISYEHVEGTDASLKLCVPTNIAASNTIQLKDFSWTAK